MLKNTKSFNRLADQLVEEVPEFKEEFERFRSELKKIKTEFKFIQISNLSKLQREKYENMLSSLSNFKNQDNVLKKVEQIKDQIQCSNYKELVDRDHCHFTGKFKGAAQHSCNLNFSFKTWRISVIFHNFKDYDSHFIVAAIDKKIKRISCIANSKEKLMT